MIGKDRVVNYFKELSYKTDGIEGLLHEGGHDAVFRILGNVDSVHVTKVQFNQLLVLSLQAGISDDFFRYYWLSVPGEHSYDVKKIDDYLPGYESKDAITSLQHLRWGLKRLYVDGLLYFGNINNAYNSLRNKSYKELETLFVSKRFPTEAIKKRGAALELKSIAKDDRYLIAEMACKTYGSDVADKGALKKCLIDSYEQARREGKTNIPIRDLLTGEYAIKRYEGSIPMFKFAADEIFDEAVSSRADIERHYEAIEKKFTQARIAAQQNTEYYLSMVNDLDVYVATSMRSRQDFRKMADYCEQIFQNKQLQGLHLRYFDPTLSAADGHEDKGLIECLMVKCAKVLVYCAGDRDSYGKDAEAAMALSMGKPVIFYCDEPHKMNFFREVHPLSRLINFSTGVAVGAIVTDKLNDVSQLLFRIFENQMEYRIEQSKPGYFRLKEKLTDSVMRIQTNHRLLSKSFWNYYIGNGSCLG